MLQRRVQFVLCYGRADVPGRLDEGRFPVVTLGTDALVPVCAPDAQGRPLYTLDGGAPLAVLDYSDSSGLGRILRSRLREIFAAPVGPAHHPVSIVFTAHNAFLLKTMALAGRGMAWLPASLVSAEIAGGQLLPAGDERWTIGMEIRLYRQNAQMAPTAEALWRVVGEGELPARIPAARPGESA